MTGREVGPVVLEHDRWHWVLGIVERGRLEGRGGVDRGGTAPQPPAGTVTVELDHVRARNLLAVPVERIHWRVCVDVHAHGPVVRQVGDVLYPHDLKLCGEAIPRPVDDQPVRPVPHQQVLDGSLDHGRIGQVARGHGQPRGTGYRLVIAVLPEHEGADGVGVGLQRVHERRHLHGRCPGRRECAGGSLD